MIGQGGLWLFSYLFVAEGVSLQGLLLLEL